MDRRPRTTGLHASLTIGALATLAYVPSIVAASACDEFASRLIEKAIRSAIETLNCGQLGEAGLDFGEHHLQSVCYSSSGPSSQIEIVADLKCRTADKALIRSESAERVTANADVRGADCQIIGIDVSASGEMRLVAQLV